MHVPLKIFQELDTALLKLYAETDSSELIALIASEPACDMQDCITWLEKCKRYHAQALLYKYHGENDKALNIWTRIASGELQDDIFPGIEFIVEFLAK